LELVTDFEIFVPDVDEEALTVADPYATAESLAQAKARTVFAVRPDSLVIGGDTVVALPLKEGGFTQFSKPTSNADAVKMLTALSGQTHWVITALCLVWADGEIVFSDTTKVTFRKLTAKEIKEYVATGIPMDKAGGYAIQEGANKFVTSVDGSESTVIGLPTERLIQAFDELKTKSG
jgi:septum formation protein